jgi:hypothetical protein
MTSTGENDITAYVQESPTVSTEHDIELLTMRENQMTEYTQGGMESTGALQPKTMRPDKTIGASPSVELASAAAAAAAEVGLHLPVWIITLTVGLGLILTIIIICILVSLVNLHERLNLRTRSDDDPAYAILCCKACMAICCILPLHLCAKLCRCPNHWNIRLLDYEMDDL